MGQALDKLDFKVPVEVMDPIFCGCLISMQRMHRSKISELQLINAFELQSLNFLYLSRFSYPKVNDTLAYNAATAVAVHSDRASPLQQNRYNPRK